MIEREKAHWRVGKSAVINSMEMRKLYVMLYQAEEYGLQNKQKEINKNFKAGEAPKIIIVF